MKRSRSAHPANRHRRSLARITWSGRASRFIFALVIIAIASIWIVWKLAPTADTLPTQQTTIPYATRSVAPLTPARVTRVVDGDTIDVIVDGQRQRVRYTGIDTPERGEAGYREATQFNRLLLGSGEISLEKDVSERDRYDRLLRYIYLPDGRMVNEMLVAEGWAAASPYPPDVKYADRFHAAEASAREAGRGLWQQ